MKFSVPLALALFTSSQGAFCEDSLLSGKDSSQGACFILPIQKNEASSFLRPLPFSRSALFGDDAKSGRSFAAGNVFAVLDFGACKRVSKVKVKLRFDKDLGAERISVSSWKEVAEARSSHAASHCGDMPFEKLEDNLCVAQAKPLAAVPAVDGWNEIALDVETNLIVLKFDCEKGARQISISQIEAYGGEIEDSHASKELVKFKDSLTASRKRAADVAAALEKEPNLAFSGDGAKCWTTMMPWPGTSEYQADCVLNQKDGGMSASSAWARPNNYWAACFPVGFDSNGGSAPQTLVVTLPKKSSVSVCRLIWLDDIHVASDFSLEFFDGSRWNLLCRDEAHSGQTATYLFDAVEAEAFRLTMYKFEGEGEGRLLMRSFQVYSAKGLLK